MLATYDDIHRLVDRLTPDQAEVVRAVVRQFVTTPDPQAEDGRARRLSFIGLMHSGESDLAARSEDIIRAEFDAR